MITNNICNKCDKCSVCGIRDKNLKAFEEEAKKTLPVNITIDNCEEFKPMED